VLDGDGSFKSPFTAAQVRILECFRAGLLPKDVPAKLGIANKTVWTQIHRMCVRAGVANWLEALSVYRRIVGEDPLTKVGGVSLTQAELQRRWNQAPSIDVRAAAFIVKLDTAERLMRELLEPPIIHRQWPETVVDLLDALEALDKARTHLKAAPLHP
jgi:DNA-binding CsgD family transcriptional regulator